MIEPGQLFTIEYGNGHMLEVRALAGRKQAQLAKTLSQAGQAEVEQNILALFDASLEALKLCVGDDAAESLWDDHVDAELAMEIAGKTLGKQALSEDDKKKLESPHLSGAASSAEHVEINVRKTTSVA